MGEGRIASKRRSSLLFTIAIRVAAILIVVMLILIVIAFLGYFNPWPWTGVTKVASRTWTATWTTKAPSGPTTITEFQEEKTLWDWMQLLIIPVTIPITLGIAAYLFKYTLSREEQENTLDSQRQTLLNEYTNKMSDLVHGDSKREVVLSHARTRTRMVLPDLDGKRKGSILQFLDVSDLIGDIDLSGADLSEVDLPKANLRDAKLQDAYLIEAKLPNANLSGANLSKANLSKANLSEAKLENVDLSSVLTLEGVNLSKVDLSNFDLSGVNLKGANLSEAKLPKADLSKADLSGAKLPKANLRKTNLSGANLVGADLSETSLNKTNLEGAEYNTQKIKKTIEGVTYPLEPTKWPLEFDPVGARAIEVKTVPES